MTRSKCDSYLTINAGLRYTLNFPSADADNQGAVFNLQTQELEFLGLIKRTYFGENRNIEFRAEAFNVTNTPPLGAPNVVAGAAGFGSITSAGDPRVLQFGLKVNF